jgi:hypothetical protein
MARLLLGGFAVGLVLAAGACRRRSSPIAQLGESLFDGRRSIAAHLFGDETPLPADAARCANCHLRVSGIVDAGAATTQTFGPPLTALTLRETRPRRGGPPTRYDEGTFCRLLVDGVDPAQILIQRAMPRYAADAAACRALWEFLAESP